jgi:hypothetical protein
MVRFHRHLVAGMMLAVLTVTAFAQQVQWSEQSRVPPAPEYAKPNAWLTRPVAPARPVAVFFVHPTTYFLPVIGNARYDQGMLTASLNGATTRLQASAFAGCCDIWAPQYRQSSLRTITAHTEASYAADDLAYGDVDRAFAAFVAGLAGRPFILAGHSQGSIHAFRLLQQRIIGTALQRDMIAAYLPGLALPAEIRAKGLPVCQDASATGCVVSWNTVRLGVGDGRRAMDALIWWDGHYQPISGRQLACVNPVNWIPGGAADQPGAISIHAEGRGGPASTPVPALDRAECQADGLLGVVVDPRYTEQFRDLLTGRGIYHDFDYALFFASIADNARQRIAAFNRPR